MLKRSFLLNSKTELCQDFKSTDTNNIFNIHGFCLVSYFKHYWYLNFTTRFIALSEIQFSIEFDYMRQVQHSADGQDGHVNHFKTLKLHAAPYHNKKTADIKHLKTGLIATSTGCFTKSSSQCDLFAFCRRFCCGNGNNM